MTGPVVVDKECIGTFTMADSSKEPKTEPETDAVDGEEAKKVAAQDDSKQPTSSSPSKKRKAESTEASSNGNGHTTAPSDPEAAGQVTKSANGSSEPSPTTSGDTGGGNNVNSPKAKKVKTKPAKSPKVELSPEAKAKAKAEKKKFAEENPCAVCGKIDLKKHLTIFYKTDSLPKIVLHSNCGNDDYVMLSAAAFKKHYGASKDVVEAYKKTRTADGPVRFGNVGKMVLEHEFRDNYTGTTKLITSLAQIRADIRKERSKK